MSGTLTITAAELIQYDPRTDVRQPTGFDAGEDDLCGLNEALYGGAASLVGGLVGWGAYTHTLHHHEDSSVWHVRVGE